MPTRRDDDRSRVRELYFPTQPRSGESLRGFIMRACFDNGLPNTFSVMRYLGQRHRNRLRPSEDETISADAMAAMFGCDPEALERMRYPAVGLRRRHFYKAAVHQDRIETKVRRFSPAALRTNDTHLAIWELNDLPFCPIGWDMLIDTCPCRAGPGTVQAWARAATGPARCDECGRRLDELYSDPVPEALRPVLAMVAGLVDPDSEFRRKAVSCLPPTIRHADPGMLFSIACRTARFLEAEGRYVPSIHISPTLEGLHAAGSILLDWPQGIEEINAFTRCSSRSLRRLLSDYAELSSGGEKLCEITAPVISWALDEPGHLAAKPASKVSRLSIETLEAIWSAGLVTKHGRRHGNRIVPAFDEGELIEVATRWNDREDTTDLAVGLALPKYAIEQMAALEIIDENGVRVDGEGPKFAGGTLQAFRSALGDSSSRLRCEGSADFDGAQSMLLKELMNRIGGRPKPWGPALRELLNGSIAFSWNPDLSIGDIRISTHDGSDLAELTFEKEDHPDFAFDPAITKRDALEIINASVHRTYLLTELMPPADPQLGFLIEDVEALAARMITTAEMAARLRMSFAAAHRFAREAGLQPIARAAYDRSEFESMLNTDFRRVVLKVDLPHFAPFH